MVTKGIALRFKEDYADEIKFAKSHNFDFFQVWFYNGELCANSLSEPREIKIKEHGFPIIIHAAFDINDFEKHGQRLLELVEFFGHSEVIIHPVCTSETITEKTVFTLAKKLDLIYEKLEKRDVKLYVENNSTIDGFFNSVEDLRVVFDNNTNFGLLIDLAHINDYDHLINIVKMRRPECIHIADKRFGVPHEHLTLGKGDLDFHMIFRDIIPDFDGRIILEAVKTKNGVAKSKGIIDRLF